MIQNNEIQKPVVENISCIIPENEQLGALFLGNVYGAQNAAILKQYGIRAIITASAQTKISHQIEDIPFHLKIDAHDKDEYYIVEHVNDCIHFIQQNRKITNVFVHCYAGVSRSSAIVAAYLMWKYRWPLEKTISFIVSKRIVAKPNDGFYKQLKQVEIKLNISSQNINQINSAKIQKEIPSKPAIQPLNDVLLVKRPASNKVSLNVQKAQPPPLQIQNFNNSSQQLNSPKGDAYVTQMQNLNIMKPGGGQWVTHSQGHQNHNNIPIPKVLARKPQQSVYTNNDYYEERVENKQKGRKSIYNFKSPEMIPKSPRNTLLQSNNSKNISYSNSKDRNGEGSIYTAVNSTALNSSQRGLESQQKQKTGSRCIIRPKDLPGYKNY